MADGITVSASANTTIMTFAIGGALGAAGGGSGGQGIGLAGAGTGNTITNTVEAYLRGGVNAQAGSGGVSISATDASRITANGGGLGIGVITGDGGSSTGVSLGAAIAINSISNTVLAFIDDSTASGEATISVTASETADVWALTIGGAVAVSTGDSTSTSVALAGAGSGNTVTNDTEARIVDGSSVTTTTAGDVSLTATDDSSVQAYAGGLGVAIAVSSGGTAAGVGVGVAASTNTVTSTVKAFIDGSNVTAAGGVYATATQGATIVTYTIGGAVSVAASSDGNGAAGAIAGAASVNAITDTIEAYINDATTTGVTANDGPVVLASTDTSAITANGGGVGFAVGAGEGNGGAVTIGFSAAQNTISDTIQTWIAGSSVTANAPKGTSHEIDLSASDAATVSALTIGGAVAGGGGENGLGVGAAGAGSGNTVTSNVWSLVDAASTLLSAQSGGGAIAQTTPQAAASECSSQSARGPPAADGDINIVAVNCATIVANAGGVGIAVGVGTDGAGIGASLGVAFSLNTISGETQAFISSSGVTAAGNVTVTAVEAASISSLTLGGAVSVGGGEEAGVAVAIAVTVAQNAINDTVAAYIAGVDNHAAPAAGAISVSALRSGTVTAYVVAAAVSVAVGEVGVSVAGGGAAATNTILGGTNAYLSGSSLGAGGAVSITSTDSSAITAVVAAAAASVGVGTSAGVGVAIGISVARNLIGWEPTGIGTPVSTTYNSTVMPAGLNTGDTVTVTSGAYAGRMFTYTGSDVTGSAVYLSRQNFADTSLWKDVTGTVGTPTYTTADTPASVSNGATVMVTSGPLAGHVYQYLGATLSGEVDLASENYGNTTDWAPYYAATTYTTTDQPSALNTNDTVLDPSSGREYRYVGTGISGGVNLSTQNYANTSNWVNYYQDTDQPLALNTGDTVLVDSGPLAGQSYQYTGSDLAGTVQWDRQDFSNTSLWTNLGTGYKSPTATTDDAIAALAPQATVEVEGGTYKGDTFRYLGSTPLAGTVDLSVQSYDDPSAWEQVGTTNSAGQVQAYSSATSIDSSGALTITATETSSINATVVAAAVAVAGGGDAGVGVSAGGAFAQNVIENDLRAYVNGDGASGIRATSATITATDAAGIHVLAGAASVAAAVGADAGIAVSIGLGIALNSVSGAVTAYIANATHALNTTTGGVAVSATENGIPVVDATTSKQLNLAGYGVSGAQLDAVAALDTAHQQTTGAATLSAIKAAFANGGITLPASISVSPLDGSDPGVTPAVAGTQWEIVASGGPTYIVTLANGKLLVSQSTIDAVAFGASLAAGFGDVGIAVSGAGAVAINDVTTQASAHIDASTIVSFGAVSVQADSIAAITATVAAVSLAVGGGGSAGIGVSIGVSIAQNEIGTAGTPGDVEAYLLNSSVDAEVGNLTLTATSAETIGAFVLAASVAIGVGGEAGVGASGAGTSATNAVAVYTEAYIDGSGAAGISAFAITLSAHDSSTIQAFAGAASLAAAGGAYAGVAVSIGIALAENDIANVVQASISNAATEVHATSGAVALTAIEAASINAVTWAASVAVGGGVAGLAFSGAGASALNDITTQTNAFIAASTNVTSAGAVTITASDTSAISSVVAAASASVGAGGAGVAVSIGVALARNIIGFAPNPNATFDYTSDQTLTGNNANPALADGKVVKVDSGPRSGSFYKYVGPVGSEPSSIDLSGQDYGNPDDWSQVGLTSSPLQARAYVDHSSVSAGGALTETASASQTINAIVIAASVAVAVGADGVAGTGAGASAQNTVDDQVAAYVNYDGTSGISAASVALSAGDNSSITVFTGGISLGAAIGPGGVGAAISIGVALAANDISSTVAAYIANAAAPVATHAGGVSLSAQETGAISSTTVAASLAVGIGEIGVGIAGAGAQAVNAITGSVDAYIDSSTVHSAGAVSLTASTPAPPSNNAAAGLSISSTVGAVAASLAGGGGGVGAAIGVAIAQNLIGYNPDGSTGSALPAVCGVQGAAQIVSCINNSTVIAGGAVSQTATSGASITATVFSVAVAVSAGDFGIGLGGAGFSAVNESALQVGADITGSSTVVDATSLNSAASDTSAITAGAGTGALAAGIGGVGVAMSVAAGVAENEIFDSVTSKIDGASRVSTQPLLASSATNATLVPGDTVTYGGFPATATYIAGASSSIGGTSSQDDQQIKTVSKGVEVTLSSGYLTPTFTTASGSRSVLTGDRVQVGSGYTKGGTVGATYEYTGAAATIDLSTQDYTQTGWTAVTIGGTEGASYAYIGNSSQSIDLNNTDYSNTSLWTQIGGRAGTVYAYDGPAGTGNNLSYENYANSALWTAVTPAGVSLSASENATITSTAAAASLAVGVGAVAGVSFSLSGAIAQNVILTDTNAFINSTTLASAGNVSLTSTDGSTISATVVAASAAVGVGGEFGGAVSIGFSTVTNDIGYTAGGTKSPAQVQAYVSGASLSIAGTLTQTATSTQSITANVTVVAAAVAGGAVAVAGSGAGVNVTNNVATQVEAYITSTTGQGVSTGGAITLAASDTSTITATALAVSVSASVGLISGAVSLGVALADNTIVNLIKAYVSDSTVNAGGTLSMSAAEAAGVNAHTTAAAASFSAIALSGAGANDTSTVTPTVDASIDTSTVTASGAISLAATADLGASSFAGGQSYSSGISAAGSTGTTTLTPTVTTSISGNSVKSTGGGIALTSLYNANADGSEVAASAIPTTSPTTGVGASATSEASSGALVAGSGATATATDSGIVKAFISGGNPKATGAITLLSVGYVAPSATTQGISGGVLGIGSSQATATAQATSQAYVSGTVAGGASLSITAIDAESPASSATAFSGGILAGDGAQATSNVQADGSSDPAASASLSAPSATISGAVTLSATFTPGGSATTGGGSFGGVSVGASVSSVDANANVSASVANSVAVQSGSLSVSANRTLPAGSPAYSENATANASAGALIGIDSTSATASAEGSVTASIGSSVTLPSGDVSVAANDASSQFANASGWAYGVIAAGASTAHATSAVVTKAELGASPVTTSARTGLLDVTASGTDENTAQTRAGSGGVIAGNASESKTGDTSSVTTLIDAPLSGTPFHIYAGGLTVSSSHTSGYAATSDSTSAGVLNGSGATATASASTPVATTVGANLEFDLSGGAAITAYSHFVRLDDPNATVSAAGGGAITVNAAISTTTVGDGSTSAGVTGPGQGTVVGLGNNDEIIVTSTPLSTDGILISAASATAVSDNVTLSTGGAISGAGVESDITATISPTVTIGTGGTLSSTGDVAIGTYVTTSVNASSAVSTWGLAAVGSANANATVNSTQSVSIGGTETIAAFGNAVLTAGGDPSGSNPSLLTASSAAESYVRGFIAIPTSDANTTINSNATLTISSGASVTSGENATVQSYQGFVNPTSDGTAHGYELGFIPVTNHNNNNYTSGTGAMTIDGSVAAGIYHSLSVTIADCKDTASFYCSKLTAVDSAPNGSPFIASFNGGENIPALAQTLFSGIDLQTVDAGVSSTPVGTMFLGDLFASGGDATISADSVGGSGTVTAYGGPTISIFNSSPDYLITGAVTIPDIPGGHVDWTGAAQSGVATNPVNAGQGGAITIENLYVCTNAGGDCVGNSDYGPALIATGNIENDGGAVTIENDYGSYFKASTAGIFGQQVNVTVPNGIAVLSTSAGAPWANGTDPYGQWTSYMIWPGGNPNTQGTPNADLGAAYAVNSMYPGYGSAAALTIALTGSAGEYDSGTAPYGYAGETLEVYGYCAAFADASNLQATCAQAAANSLSPLGQSYAISGSNFDQRWFPLIPIETLSESTNSFASASLAGAYASGSVFGSQVLITGQTIDLNAQITAGQPTNWALTIPSTVTVSGFFGIAVSLSQYVTEYQLGLVARQVAIPLDSGTATGISAVFDAATDEIIVSKLAAASGPAKVTVDGGIINTDPVGSIDVNGGLGTVNINNQSGVTLVLQNIYAGSTASVGSATSSVELIDTNRMLDTLYSYTNGTVTTSTRPVLSVNADGTGNVGSGVYVVQGSGGPNIVYSLQSGMRWNWALNATLSRTYNGTGDANTWSVGNEWTWNFPTGQPNNPWSYCYDQSCDSGTQTTPYGFLTTNTGDSTVFEQSISGDLSESSGWILDYHGCGKGGPGNQVCNFGFEETNTSGCSGDNPCAGWLYTPLTSGYLTMDMSVTASEPIDINFGGTSTGTVNVTSNSPVIINGQITNPDGSTTITSTGGSVTVTPTGSITSQNLSLSAAGGLGTPTTPLPITIDNGGVLSATDSSSSGIYLKLASGAVINKITAGSGAPYGNVVVTAQGDLLRSGSASQITGDNVTITTTGAVGAANAGFLLASIADTAPSGAPIGGVVNVSAGGAIVLTETAAGGNLLVGSIASSGGDVSLVALDGSILDANGQTSAQTLDSAQIQAIWNSLGIASNAAAAIQFDREVSSYYSQYWGLLLNGTVDLSGHYTLSPGSVAAYTSFTAAALGLASPTAQDVTNYAAYLYTETVDFFNNVGTPGYLTIPAAPAPVAGYAGALLGSGWQSSADFTTYNASFSFDVTGASHALLYAALEADAVWTLDELQYAVDRSGLTAGGTPVGNTTPNVSGANVTLSASGTIGSLAAPASISLADLRSGTLTPGQIGALALASAPGDVTLVGTDANASVGAVTFAFGSQTDATTLSGTDAHGDAVSFTLLSVDGAGNLVGVDGSGQTVTLSAVEIAQTAPFFVAAQGTFSSSSGGATFVQSTAPDLKISQVTSTGGQIQLTTPHSIIKAGSSAIQISTPSDLRLVAGSGDIAASAGSTTPLVVSVGGVLRSATAGGILSLQQAASAGDLTFDSIAGGTSVTLAVPGGSLLQDTPLITDILTPTLSITVKNAVGTTTTPIDIQVSGTTSITAPSGIYLGTIGPNNALTVGSFHAAAGDVTLTIDGNVTLGQITASGTVSIFANGWIHESGDATPVPTTDAAGAPAANIIAENGVLKSLVGMGTQTAQLETDVVNLAVRSFGDMWLINYGNVTVDQITGSPIAGVIATGALNLTAYSDIIEDLPFTGATINVDAVDGGLQINAAYTAGGPADAGTISLSANTYIAFGTYTNASNQTSYGSLTEDSTGTPQITLEAGTYVSMISGTQIAGAGGDIAITATTGDVTLTDVSTTGTVSVTSTDGSIVDGNVGTATTGATDITGGQITLSAGNDVGSATDALLVDHTGSGDIGSLSATNALYLTQTGGPLQIKTATATNGDVVLTVANADAHAADQNLILADSTSSVSAPKGSITLATPGGTITLDSGATVNAGDAVTLNASGAVTLTGASVTATGDDLNVTAGSALSVHGGSLTATAGSVALTANGGDLVVDEPASVGASVSAGDAVTGDATGNVTLTGATVTADTVAADTGALALWSDYKSAVSTSLALTVHGGTLKAQNGNVDLTASGGNVLLDQSAAVTAQDAVNVAASGSVTLTGSAVTASTGDVGVTAGAGVTVDGGSVTATKGNVALTANGGGLVLDELSSVGASVSAGDAVTGDATGNVTLTGATVTADTVAADTGALALWSDYKSAVSSSLALTVHGGTLKSRNGNVDLTASGGNVLLDQSAAVTAQDAVNVAASGSVTLTGSAVTASTGDVGVTAGVGVTVDGGSVTATKGNVALTANGGGLVLDELSSVGASVSAGDAVTGDATGNVTLTGATVTADTVAADTGALALWSDYKSAVSSSLALTVHGGTLKSRNGNVDLTASGGNVLLDQSAAVTAQDAVTVAASGSVTLTGSAVTASTGDVGVTAGVGVTVDGGSVTATKGNVTLTANGGGLVLDELSTVGAVVSAAQALTGNATGSLTLTDAALTSGSGDLDLTADDKNAVSTVDALTVHGGSVKSTGANVNLATHGGALLLDQGAIVTAQDAVTAVASGSATFTGSSVTATTGDLGVTAGGDLTVDATSTVTSGATATLSGGEAGGAHTTALLGTFTAPLIEVRTGNGGDTVTLHPVALNGYTRVWGGTGANDIVLTLPSIDLADKFDAGLSGPAALINGTSAQATRLVQGVAVPLRNMVDVSGGSATSTIQVNLAAPSLPTGGTDYVVNASDSGDLLLRAPDAASTFLIRAGFVALLAPQSGASADGPFAADYQRVNYDASVGTLTIDGSNHGDTYDFIDTGAPVVVNGGTGADSFQFGGLFGQDQTVAAGSVAPGDAIATIPTAYGFLSAGASKAVTVNSGGGNDAFVVYRNAGPLTLDANGGTDSFLVQSFGITDAPVQVNAGGKGSLSVVGTPGADNLVLSARAVLGAGLNVGYSLVPALEVNGNGGNDTFTVLGTATGTVSTLDGGQSGNDTFNIADDVVGAVQAVNASGQVVIAAPFAGTHVTSGLAGELVVNGGVSAAPPALVETPQLPSELDSALPVVAPASPDLVRIATLNVFDDLSSGVQSGTLQNSGDTGILSGLGMAVGVQYSSVDVVDVLLGSGTNTFTVLGTVPGSITVVQGGGGTNDLVADGGGGPQAPLVLLASTTQDGSFYNSTASNLTGWARAFAHAGTGVLDARGDSNSVVMYGGAGDVTIYGGGGGDQIAGGSGIDTIVAGTGNDDIYGNGGFNLNLSVTLSQAIQENVQVLDVANAPTVGGSPTQDPLTASSQTIFGGAGNDVILAHWGVINQTSSTQRLISTGGVTNIYTVDGNTSAGAVIYGGFGSYIVLGGVGNNFVNLSASTLEPDVVIGHDGQVTFSHPQTFTVLGGWWSQLSLVYSRLPAIGGNNTLLLGTGPAIVIGGAGSNFIKTRGGNDIVFGNDGLVAMSGGAPTLAVSQDPSVSANNPLAGNTIIVGAGNSQVIGGSGNNRITVGAGDMVVIAADGVIHYTAGVPVLAQSRFTNFGGVDVVTVAGATKVVTRPSGYGTVGVGVVIESRKGGVLKAPAGVLVERNGGTAQYSSKQHGWVNPNAPKPKPKPKPKAKAKAKKKAPVKGKHLVLRAGRSRKSRIKE